MKSLHTFLRSFPHGILPLLLLVLLAAQLGAVQHALLHGLQTSAQQRESQQQLPAEEMVCDQCVAYAQVGDAVPGNGVMPFLAEGVSMPLVVGGYFFFSRFFFVFPARAPPVPIK